MNKDQEKELLKIMSDIGLTFNSYDEVLQSDLFKKLMSETDTEQELKDFIESNDLTDKDVKIDVMFDILDMMNRPHRFINRNNQLLLYCDLYHKARSNNYGYSFEETTGVVMVNGRLIVFYPMFEVEGRKDFDRFRVVVYKSSNIKKKDILFNEVSSDIFYLTDEVIKLCE